MSKVMSLDSHREKKMKQWTVWAEQIASEIDPRAGGFFRRCLINAGIAGMEKVDAEKNSDETSS